MKDKAVAPLALNELPVQDRFELAQQIAAKLAASKLVPEEYRGKPDDCFVAVQMGAELGMGPFQAIQSISIIDGRPCLWGDGLIGVVRASPKCEYVRESFDEDTMTAICVTKRKGDDQPVTRRFSKADAVKAGLIRSNPSDKQRYSPWYKYEKRMLQMRARSWCLRDTYADVLKGLSSAEEIVDVVGPTEVEIVHEPDTARVVEQCAKNTIEDVLTAIGEAKDMHELLATAEQAKRLWSPEDQEKARLAYRQRREELKKELDNAESE